VDQKVSRRGKKTITNFTGGRGLPSHAVLAIRGFACLTGLNPPPYSPSNHKADNSKHSQVGSNLTHRKAGSRVIPVSQPIKLGKPCPYRKDRQPATNDACDNHSDLPSSGHSSANVRVDARLSEHKTHEFKNKLLERGASYLTTCSSFRSEAPGCSDLDPFLMLSDGVRKAKIRCIFIRHAA
jgi:hypothetical protein